MCFLLQSLLDDIKSSRVKKTISVLQAARSKILKQWKELVITMF